MNGFMFDTNIFNRFLDEKMQINWSQEFNSYNYRDFHTTKFLSILNRIFQESYYVGLLK